MTVEGTSPAKQSVLRSMGAALVAFVVFILASAITSFLTAIPLVTLRLEQNVFVQLIDYVLVSAVGMWVSKRSTDAIFKFYSGRAIFILFLSLSLILATFSLVALPFNGKTILSLVQLIAICIFSYISYWKRDSSPQLIHDSPDRRGWLGVIGAFSPLFASLPIILYLVFGIIQFSAIYAEIDSVTHMYGFFSAILTGLLAYMPLVGSIVGFFGAKDVWGWHWWQAALLYFGLIPVFMVLAMVGSALDAVSSRVNRHVPEE